MKDCPLCGMALWTPPQHHGAGECVSPYCRETGKRVLVAPCGCYRVFEKNGGSDYGCNAHGNRLPDGKMPSPDFEEVLTKLSLSLVMADAL